MAAPPPIYRRTVDASVFLSIYLEQDVEVYHRGGHSAQAQTCQGYLEEEASWDTVLTDLTLGEVLKNLLEQLSDDRVLEEALVAFARDVRRFSVHPLDEPVFRTASHPVIQDLWVQPKDKLLLAFAIQRRLSKFATRDKGIYDEREKLRRLGEEINNCPLSVDYLGE